MLNSRTMQRIKYKDRCKETLNWYKKYYFYYLYFYILCIIYGKLEIVRMSWLINIINYFRSRKIRYFFI